MTCWVNSSVSEIVMWLMLSLLACENGCHNAAKVIPALEMVDPSWGAEPVDCDVDHPDPEARDGCITRELQCNTTFEATTRGGKNHFGDDFYQKGFCTPQRNNYENAPEAIYQLRVKPNTQVDLRLDSNCADLDLVAMSWEESRCPTDKHATTIQKECEMNTKSDGGTLRLTTVNNPQTYLIAVDGKQGAFGNFRLTVNCKTYR